MSDQNGQFKGLKDLVHTKASVKQDVFAVAKESFLDLKEVLSEMTQELAKCAKETDERVAVSLTSEGDFRIQIILGGDTVVFHLHTNVFTFPPAHVIHKHSYVRGDSNNAYCGIIHVYNFLSDSFKYHRLNDSGYLIARIFVNRERKFFVEGRGQLGIRFNDFGAGTLQKPALRDIATTALTYALNFELFTPPFRQVDQVLLSDIQEMSQNLKLRTAKRLGFRFESDEDEMIDF
ncbi:MAG: hypothetical protein RLP15_12170 [Cryomorphaceae bacterium]